MVEYDHTLVFLWPSGCRCGRGLESGGCRCRHTMFHQNEKEEEEEKAKKKKKKP